MSTHVRVRATVCVLLYTLFCATATEQIIESDRNNSESIDYQRKQPWNKPFEYVAVFGATIEPECVGRCTALLLIRTYDTARNHTIDTLNGPLRAWNSVAFSSSSSLFKDASVFTELVNVSCEEPCSPYGHACSGAGHVQCSMREPLLGVLKGRMIPDSFEPTSLQPGDSTTPLVSIRSVNLENLEKNAGEVVNKTKQVDAQSSLALMRSSDTSSSLSLYILWCSSCNLALLLIFSFYVMHS